MTHVYLVIQHIQYEAPGMDRVYADKQKAERRVKRLNAKERKRVYGWYGREFAQEEDSFDWRYEHLSEVTDDDIQVWEVWEWKVY